ncbi:MAG TPA: chemotaxis protein CheW [Spirochaetota bacterium]|nr:chemotaxis protein CheW [Spirochaetota bacterium]HNU92842.1 chemotaxis protein CheW [Spirochaetota bacterium]HPV99148.1 chemotaxis protein CheW [Spirochaetota bacterium]
MSETREKMPEEPKQPEDIRISRTREKVERAEEENQFVTFVIGEETYGVEVLRVQEIIGMTRITHVPNAMSFMKGVINLRGSVVPVVDMRIKFGMAERDYDAFTVIIIVEVRGRMIGMIVDSVSDVVNIPVRSIQDTPHFSAKIETDFIMGIGQVEEKLVIILDVDRIMSSEEMTELDRERTA